MPRPGGVGRPRKWPAHLIADKGDSYERCRPGCNPRFDRATSRRRTVVERGSNRLTQCRAVAIRFDKRAANYRAMVVVASILVWLGA